MRGGPPGLARFRRESTEKAARQQQLDAQLAAAAPRARVFHLGTPPGGAALAAPPPPLPPPLPSPPPPPAQPFAPRNERHSNLPRWSQALNYRDKSNPKAAAVARSLAERTVANSPGRMEAAAQERAQRGLDKLKSMGTAQTVQPPVPPTAGEKANIPLHLRRFADPEMMLSLNAQHNGARPPMPLPVRAKRARPLRLRMHAAQNRSHH